jgi:SAM-dependent methyltransferase
MASVKWFAEGATEEYLALYPHRDEREARLVVDLIGACIRGAEGTPALDVACGAGRHRQCLGSRRWTIGIDVSWPLLAVARAADQDAPLVQADMRALPFATGAFGLVVNLFTSFGYFDDDREHQQVMAEIARVTAPDGWFVLDFLNASFVRRTLVPFDRRRLGTLVVEQTRDISTDGRYVRKAVRFEGCDHTFLERVRLFEAGELAEMVESAGFSVSHMLGSYDGGAISPWSPRTIIIGRRRVRPVH